MRGTARWNSKILHYLMEKGPYHGYIPDLEKSWHICAEDREEEESRADFEAEGLNFHFTRCHLYLGEFCSGREEMYQ